MPETLRFLPWARGGMGRMLDSADEGQMSVERGAGFDASIEIDAVPVLRRLSLRSPDQVAAIDPGHVARRYPEPGTPDAEYGYFPHIEFVTPGLPWVLSPFAPDESDVVAGSTGRLRPWIGLVCVEASLATIHERTEAPHRQLTVASELLPAIEESWAWAHVQCPADVDFAAAAANGSGEAIARLVCPRKLEPRRTYLAAVVNLWRREGETLVPSWGSSTGPVTLDVFDRWTFGTGDVGSFEALCERLGPVPANALTLGVNPMDVSDLGLLEVAAVEPGQTVDYSGALLDEDVNVAQLRGAARDGYEVGMTDLLNQGDVRRALSLDDPDPVVTPPLYGAYAQDLHTLPSEGWMRQLSLPPRRRAAAGIGAQIVREHQERFMALAWDQAGAVREVNRQLSLVRLQAEAGRTWKAKVARLDALMGLAVLRPQMTFARTKRGTPVRVAVARSTLPNGLIGPAMKRAIRPAGVVSRTMNADRSFVVQPGEEVALHRRGGWREGILGQLGDPEARAQLAYGRLRTPVGMHGPDPRREQASRGEVPAPGGTIPDIAEPIGRALGESLSLGDAVVDTLDAIRPIRSAKDRIAGRVLALQGRFADLQDYELPTRVTTGPIIDEALAWLLMEKSSELLCPGIRGFPNNAVRLLEADPAFVASFLAGANHEFARELLWREYPADLGWTTFRRFWDRPDPDARDIDPMDGWDVGTKLAELGIAGGETAVLLVRGDLIRQYRNVRILLKSPDDPVAMTPSFVGSLPPDVRFLGFDVPDTEPITDPPSPDREWKIIIEEQPTEPRFGLDLARVPGQLKTYAELSWEHLEHQTDETLRIAPEVGLSGNAALAAEATWGLNSAHMAFATYQKPFRRVFNATDLLREPPT